MGLAKTLWRGALAALILVAGAAALATNYSLWVNGRGGGGQPGNHLDFSYWGPGTTAAGINKRSVNWDGTSHIADQNHHVRNALDCYCTGTNWCYIAAHSAGNLQIGYALAMYGGSTRLKKNAAPDGSGVCGNTDGSTQTGWNIKFVDVAAGAAGGSELADLGEWALSEPLVSDLRTSTARALYNHNSTRSLWFYLFTGSGGAIYSGLLPGQDDGAVAYHSAGGTAGASGRSLCNPSDWFCDDLTLGTAKNQGGSTKWSFHSVRFRDDKEQYDHGPNGNWGGAITKMRADMVTNAK